MTVPPPSTSARRRHRVVVVGGGFGGLAVTRALRHAAVDVTLVDRRNHHVFQPLLYQVATGELTPASIAAPLRSLLAQQRNARVLLGRVDAVDFERKEVAFEGRRLEFDSLVVACGARHGFFGRDDWESLAPGLKTIEDATEMRRRLFIAFEAAERETDPERVGEWLTFVIVGAGPTGVELAGALSETAHYALEHDFRSIDPSQARILLVEAGERVLSMYPEELSRRVAHKLARLGVEVHVHTRVVELGAEQVDVEVGGVRSSWRARTVLWAAGSVAASIGQCLVGDRTELLDRSGRVIVEPDCSVPGHPDVFVIGDLAHFRGVDGKPLPALAPVAMQQGRHVARVIARRLGGGATPAFRFKDPGQMAVVGRFCAAVAIGRWQSVGPLAWAAWLFVHLMQITLFRNRLLVLIQWGFSFFTRDRGSRLITQVVPPDLRR